MIISSYDELDDQFNDNDIMINQNVVMEPEEINNEEQDQVKADIANQNLDY
ncbi:5520_t:CDS:1, partial [Racocetra persica]